MTAKELVYAAVYDMCAMAAQKEQAVVDAQTALDTAKSEAIEARKAAKQISDALGVDLAKVNAEVDASAAVN